MDAMHYLFGVYMRVVKRAVLTKFAVFLLLAVFSSCRDNAAQQSLPLAPGESRVFNSFREIPGITDDEIAAVEALKARGTPLIYAASRSTELFEQRDGTLGGYTVLLCDWLSDLFGISFEPRIMGLGAML